VHRSAYHRVVQRRRSLTTCFATSKPGGAYDAVNKCAGLPLKGENKADAARLLRVAAAHRVAVVGRHDAAAVARHVAPHRLLPVDEAAAAAVRRERLG
jgi:hypothetical protein